MRFAMLMALSIGCGEGKGGEIADCDADGLAGIAQATVDGMEWSASGGSWSEAGSSIQINLESTLGVSMNLRAIRSESGASVADLMGEGSFPFVVDLAGEDGSGSVMDQRTGMDSFASSQPGGWGSMSILGLQGSTLTACFQFDAINSGGVIMEIRDGKVEIDG